MSAAVTTLKPGDRLALGPGEWRDVEHDFGDDPIDVTVALIGAVVKIGAERWLRVELVPSPDLREIFDYRPVILVPAGTKPVPR